MIVYHGTDSDFYPPFKERPTFFSGVLEFAYNHAVFNADEEDERPVILKCELMTDLTFLFDPRSTLHRASLLVHLPPTITLYNSEVINKFNFLEAIKEFEDGVWKYLELNTVIESIKLCGFVGHIAKEDDEITYCIYNPHKKVKVLNYIGLLNTKEYEEIYDN